MAVKEYTQEDLDGLAARRDALRARIDAIHEDFEQRRKRDREAEKRQTGKCREKLRKIEEELEAASLYVDAQKWRASRRAVQPCAPPTRQDGIGDAESPAGAP